MVFKLRRIFSTKVTKRAGDTLHVCMLCGLFTTDKEKMQGHQCILG